MGKIAKIKVKDLVLLVIENSVSVSGVFIFGI